MVHDDRSEAAPPPRPPPSPSSSPSLASAAAELGLALALSLAGAYAACEKAAGFGAGPRWSHPTGSYLAWSGAGAAFLLAARVLSSAPLQRLARRVLRARDAARPDRVARFAMVVFKTVWYFGITAFGLYSFTATEWLPPCLGGIGDADAAFAGWPRHEATRAQKQWYILQMAYHLHSCAYLIARGRKRNDRVEMAIHHLASTGALAMSWRSNWLRVGILVVVAHDCSDIFTYGVKVVVDTGKKLPTGVLYVGCLASWAWMRLYVLPWVIIGRVITLAPPLMGAGPAYAFAACLGALFALHVYWYVLILRIGWRAARSGSAEDTYQRPLAEKKK